MRICLVSQEYPPESASGGIGTQTWNKAHELADLGHEVHVLSAASGTRPGLRTTDNDGIVVHRLRTPGAGLEVNEPGPYWLGYAWTVFRHLRELEASSRFDLVNFPEYGAEGYVYQLDRTPWSWTPVVVQLHGPLAMFTERIGWPEEGSEFWRVGTHMEETVIRLADGLMASSANIADFTAGHYDVDRGEIDVVHCGIDADLFSPPERGQAAGRPTVLFVGNIAGNKGARTVLEAVLTLTGTYPDILLRMVGKADGRFASRLCAVAEAAGAGDVLDLVGFVEERDQLPAFYREADVFCSPALHEVGVANVYVEAMACGCPVVAATTGGAPEAVEDGVSGFLVEPGDVEATANAIDRVLADNTLRDRLGRGGRARVEAYFARERYIERVLAAYERTIDAATFKRDRTIPEPTAP